MQAIPRKYLSLLERYLVPNRVVFIVGPRRAGKTTLLRQLVASHPELKHRFLMGDSIKVQELLSSRDPDKLAQLVEGLDLLVIDEVHFIPNVGYSLKLLVDLNLNIKIVVFGSASLDLIHQVGEPLVGRKFDIKLLPLAVAELREGYFQTDFDLKERLAEFLVYGLYPEVFLLRSFKEKRVRLNSLVESYLLRDILVLEEIRYPLLLNKLLRLLAYQIGSQVSHHELATTLGIDVKTVERYLWLLEQSFIIKPLFSYSRNLRNELKKSKKYYFLDLGVRNAVINNFSSLDERNDVGALWENFLFIERLKYLNLNQEFTNSYFWRTKFGQEVDLVEERGGKLYGYEFKWSTKKKPRAPKQFLTAYPNSTWQVITPENYLEFVGGN